MTGSWAVRPSSRSQHLPSRVGNQGRETNWRSGTTSQAPGAELGRAARQGDGWKVAASVTLVGPGSRPMAQGTCMYYRYTKDLYGDNAAAAFFVLTHRGRVRFQGQETWFCVDQRGKFSFDFLQLRDVPVVAIDLAGSVLNYDGVDNLVKLTALQSLDLSRCPHVDDWTLSRLHVFKDSLEELSLAGCPQVTERGLACLHQLEHLRRLELSHLPSVPVPGLVRILVEEMLPRCEVVGLAPVSGAQTSRDGREEPSGARRAGEIPA
ncbi:hypothetical protein KIL84_001596 [Mauremys mutica]|uniref:Distal membrane-arm assembly complex protein 2 n=1 Tax=Mauremys mutica TaxID=74926 RepID=A0A9D3XJ83_9SAUR|nr:hypothetical protein KIL84_001596 [Mauremys mutica]